MRNFDPMMMFVDMNSFFASVEQQVNYWLRGRPVAVCVYTGKYGCVIAPSIEAKKRGIKLGLRLNEAIKICPELVPLETHPTRYREYHLKIINVLKKYADEVIPRSIDEALIDFSTYSYVHKDLTKVAKNIKKDIHDQVGDWLKCSIGIAPNAFLAKLGTEIQKPDGLVYIDEKNIDEILMPLKLTDLPGIADGMDARLKKGGINTPIDLKYAKPDYIMAACHSIVGYYWHKRLNFQEVENDISHKPYKSMQAMRQISKEQRKNIHSLHELMLSLCMTLEKRMVRNAVYARQAGIYLRYENGFQWDDKMHMQNPLQDGIQLLNMIKYKMEKYREKMHIAVSMINDGLTSMGVFVTDFVPDQAIQYHLFENNVKNDTLRKTVYKIKDKYGTDAIIKAAELTDEPILKDVIGFGSVKDIHDERLKFDF
ncbi:MAG: DNA polymerase IV [Cytophagales bacterium]|nr:DNA polymerase IV [Cytophagales bacterium]